MTEKSKCFWCDRPSYVNKCTFRSPKSGNKHTENLCTDCAEDLRHMIMVNGWDGKILGIPGCPI